jgi:hypothetical protein
MSNKYIKELETNIEQAKDSIELGLSLERLFSNRDFKRVILNGYFKDEAVRLVHLKGALEYQSSDAQKDIISKIDAISNFSIYLANIVNNAELANKTVILDEETRNEIISEDLNNG